MQCVMQWVLQWDIFHGRIQYITLKGLNMCIGMVDEWVLYCFRLNYHHFVHLCPYSKIGCYRIFFSFGNGQFGNLP